MATELYPKIEYTETELKNGLRVILSPDDSAPIVAVNLWYDVGSLNDEEGKTGLAHLFEHMMFEGSKNMKKGELVDFINSIGGLNNASTGIHRTNYFEWGPSQHLETMLWMEADRMGGLPQAITKETLDNQRDVIKNERREVMENAPYGEALEKTQKTLFDEDHPFAHEVIGSMDDLDAASVKDVKDFFKTYYAPNNAVLSVVGDFDSDQALKWIKKYFGGIPKNTKIPSRPSLTVPFTLGGEVTETHRDRVPGPGIFMSFRAPEQGTREADALEVAAAVLSAGRSSRMYQRLIRKELAVQAAAQFLELPGVSIFLTVGIGLAGGTPDVITKELVAVVDSLKTEPVGEQELARAKAQVERQIIDALESVAFRADWLSQHAVSFGTPERANERLGELLSITADEVTKAAREFLIPDNRAINTFIPGRRPKQKKEAN